MEILEMSRPVKIENDAFARLNTDWLVWIQQLILHKQLTPQRLEQISQKPETTVIEVMQALRRTGIVIEDPAGVYSINPYIHSFLVKRLREISML